MRLGLWWVIWTLVIAAGCLPRPGPIEPAPVVDQKTEPEAGIEGTCAHACDRLRVLGCREAEPTPRGATCEDVCENIQSSGFIEWDLACRAAIQGCEAVDLCEN